MSAPESWPDNFRTDRLSIQTIVGQIDFIFSSHALDILLKREGFGTLVPLKLTTSKMENIHSLRITGRVFTVVVPGQSTGSHSPACCAFTSKQKASRGLHLGTQLPSLSFQAMFFLANKPFPFSRMSVALRLLKRSFENENASARQ